MSLAKSSFAKIASEEQKTFCVAISTLQRGERERERERERDVPLVIASITPAPSKYFLNASFFDSIATI